MAKQLKSKFEIEFYELSYEALKTHAIAKKSQLIDIACDIKELLRDVNSRAKYENINNMLEIFVKALATE